jgi:nicotinate-nucleotide pyrophosphorylase (carboxylating)
VAAALAEDLGVLGDVTSIACVDPEATGVGRLVARATGIVAGTAAVVETYRQVDPEAVVRWVRLDGAEVDAGDELGTVSGRVRSLLAGERVALNLLTHCSGVATLTRRYVRSAHGRTRIRDTRKTLPGMRALQRAAVRAGGGFNHRDSLSDAVLVKDNHLAAGGISTAVARCRARWPGRIVEVECETVEQVLEAASAGADLVLVDNMAPEGVREAVATVAGAVPVEVSGGVDLDTLAAYAEAGPDFVAVGALTHSVRALDIGLDLDPVDPS